MWKRERAFFETEFYKFVYFFSQKNILVDIKVFYAEWEVLDVKKVKKVFS